MDQLIRQSIGKRYRFRHVVSVLMAILLGGFAGFGIFVLGLTAVAMSTDGSRIGAAKMLHLTPTQLDTALPICAVGSIAIGAIGCGTATARSGRIVLGPRMQWMIRSVLYGGIGTAAGCFVVAFFRGNTPQFRWYIIGAEWV